MNLDPTKLYNDLFYKAPIGYVLFDAEYRLVKVNDAFCKLVSKRNEDVIGTRLIEYICHMDTLTFENEMEVFLNKDYSESIQLILRAYDLKTYVKVICNKMKVDNIDYVTCSLIDITSEKKISKELLYLSFHDQLTGLYNRRFFDEEIKRLDVARNLPLTIVMADVNGLKLTNDSFGHKAGDELLVKVSNAIRSGCREDDIIARVGGDEFVILLPQTDTIATKQIINRINDKLKSENIKFMEISVSFGFRTKSEVDENIDEIYKMAEDIMYSRKLYESPSMRSKAIDNIIAAFYRLNPNEELHSRNVGKLCSKLTEIIGCPEYIIKEMGTVGLLHDIGKMGIDNELLNKDYINYSEKDWNDIKRHPEIGYQIIGSVHEMVELAKIILCHHERWDGTGYPKGLRELEIPKKARILSICDSYDFMTSTRNNMTGNKEEYAISELINNAGTQFDPELARIFVEKVLKKPWKVNSQFTMHSSQ